ncbi:MAG: SPASM domain-containing protein [Erysipelotrichaceae bacterium]|nr:SPASM domain-containing protein [Erysipelotrichaceae bacterium]
MAKHISVLIKPASSLCNLRCRYCFYHDISENRTIASTGIMKEEVMEKLIARISEELNENGTASISFQGGEPTMAGLPYFRRFTETVRRYPNIKPQYSIQTNATLLDEEWTAFFKENAFLVGVSLDGYQTNMDEFRYDPLKRGVFYKVLKGIDLLGKAGVDYNILTVVTAQLARHPDALFRFYKSHNFEYIQLIPCLPGLNEENNEMALTPELYASFYKDFFKVWNDDFIKTGKPLNINLFENIAAMLEGYPPYQCGMLGRCSQQFVIEANGDVYPCDFYCLDEVRLGNLLDSSFKELRQTQTAVSFIASSDCKKKPCETCRYVNICNGGCKRQNVCYLTDGYCGYQEVLDLIVPVLYQYIRQNRR